MNTTLDMTTLPFSKRAALCTHPLTKRLFSIMEKKQSNLCLAADVSTAEELLKLAREVGPYLCVLKTHIDIIDDFTPELTQELQRIANEHEFLIFEDRKFADIGNTVLQQYEGGIYKISDWASLTNAHILPGPGLIEGLQKAGKPKGNGLLLLAELSSKGNLIDESYTRKAEEWACTYSDFVVGFICQKRISSDPRLIHMTPGVQFANKKDALGQQYNTPHHAIVENGSDIIIVGRGIFQHPEPRAAAEEYRKAAFDAYLARI